MKFTVNSSDFNKIIAQMMKIIPTKPMQDIISCLLINVKANILEITATDMENTCKHVTTCTDGEDGKIAIKAKIVSDLLKTLPSTAVTFSLKENSVDISWGTGISSLPVYDTNDYPVAKDCEGEKVIIPASELENALTLAASIASQASELYPVLKGVCLDFNEHTLNVVGTDSHQLVISGISVPNNASKSTYVLPLNAVNALRNLANNTDGDIVAISDGVNIKFSTIEQTLISRLVEGQYPGYASIIPSSYATEVAISRDAIVGALKRVSVCADEQLPKVILTINNSDIVLQAESQMKVTNSKETIPHNGISGEITEVSFNSETLTNLLVRFPDKEVQMRFNGPTKATLLYPTDKDINVKALLMPVR